jgi:hypothetical protein
MKEKYFSYKLIILTIVLFTCLFIFSFPSLALIPGDFGSADNGPPDGVVDFEDLMIFALAYGSTSADANWNPDCDIAGQGSVTPDGIIDFEDLMIFAMHYGESAATVINIAAIPGVTAPVTGATPVTTITATAQYTGTVTWSPVAATFAGATQYTATITLTAKTGYTLTGVTANFFTVAGTASDTNPANSGVVTAVFPATAATVINIAEIPGVTAPVTGATPVTTITETAQYTGTVTWSPVAATFTGATQYTATITLTAKTGYTLTGVTANFFTVAGATTVTNTADSGVVTAVFPATAATVLAVGDSYGGGIVAYILQSGDPGYDASVQHGLIAATADQAGSIGIQWYNGNYVETGATDTAIGTGQANTTVIVTTQGAGSYAAQICNDLTVGSYNDWFLPSKDELNKLWINRVAIGGFACGFPLAYYWSSSENNANLAWYQIFYHGHQYYHFKSVPLRVRAVRAF